VTLHESELRRALAPLAGDPQADAARLVQALGSEPLPARRRWPGQWWIALPAAAAGLLLGLWLGSRRAQEIDRPPPPPHVDGPALLASLGPVAQVDAAGTATTLAPGATLPFGATLQTAPATLAVLRMPDGSRLFVARGSQLRVDSPESIVLAAGHLLYEAASAATGGPTVDVGVGTVVIGASAAEVWREQQHAGVYAHRDGILIRLPDGLERRVRARNRAAIEADLIRDARYAEPPIHARAWTWPLVAMIADQAEIDQLVHGWIQTGLDLRMAEFVTPAIHALGVRALPALIAWLEQSRGLQEPMRAGLAFPLVYLAGHADLGKLFELLGDPDPELRVVVQRAIIEVAGGMEYDDAFWREAAPEARTERLIEWRRKVLGG
jgi:ferric-dicitrate binding protein FerR (iron transport regulator)